MDNNLFFWIIEYIKVFLCYGFLIMVYPSIVFRKHLKGKSITYHFAFCTTAQVLIVNTVVLMLGLFHILNKFTMTVVFWGILLISIRDLLKPDKQDAKNIKYLIKGTFGWKLYLTRNIESIKRILMKGMNNVKRIYICHWIEYSILLITVVYGVIYFSWGVFHEFSYGVGDMYVHHSWINGLVNGQIFVDGVYPEAMHCVIYSLYELFGIDVYSGVLFLPIIHLIITLLSIYCFFKEVFHYRYSSVIVLILFLIVEVTCNNQIFSMARLQWALPQEYGFFCMYICVLYLIRYLKDDSFTESKREEKIVKANWNENLTVFVLALATSIAIHFYATIMAFFICLAFAIFYVRRLFSKKRVFVLIAAVFVAVFLAVIPMLGALMSGIPFQNSIDWAVGVMNNDDAEEFPAPIPEANQRKTYEDDEFLPQSGTQLAGTTGNYGNTAKNEPVKISMKEKIEQKVTVTINRIQEKIKTIYYKSYVILYQTERAQIIVAGSLLVILLALIYYIFGIGMRMVLRNRRIQGDYFIHYLAIVLSSFFYMILYCATHLGLPSVVAGARLCSTVHLLILAILIIPIDIFIDVVQRKISERFVRVVSILITIGLVFLVYISDSYHGYLYYELTKYTTTTKISNALKGQLPPNVYTIVAPTEEIYQLWGCGRHEEMVTFLQKNVEGVSYTIPTEYVFFYIEKRPMQYGQIHLFSGPKWLALDKYSYVFEAFNPSVCPNVTAMEISEDMAEHDIMYFGKPSDTYAQIYSRTVLQSKMYEWCKRFDELYPNELKTFYEDDDFVCYYIKQNTEYLYDLVIK